MKLKNIIVLYEYILGIPNPARKTYLVEQIIQALKARRGMVYIVS